MTRTAHATWEDEALHFTCRLEENAQLGFEEIWHVSQDGQTLTIERRRLGDDKLRTLVFLRS